MWRSIRSAVTSPSSLPASLSAPPARVDLQRFDPLGVRQRGREAPWPGLLAQCHRRQWRRSHRGTDLQRRRAPAQQALTHVRGGRPSAAAARLPDIRIVGDGSSPRERPAVTGPGGIGRRECATGPAPGRPPATGTWPEDHRFCAPKRNSPCHGRRQVTPRSTVVQRWSDGPSRLLAPEPIIGCMMRPVMRPLSGPLSTPRLRDCWSSPFTPSRLPGSRRMRPTLAPRSMPVWLPSASRPRAEKLVVRSSDHSGTHRGRRLRQHARQQWRGGHVRAAAVEQQVETVPLPL